MRIELEEKISDITDEERKMWDDLNIVPKDRRFKWRKIWLYTDAIFALKEVTNNESIIEFNDTTTTVVKGAYNDLKAIIQKAEEPEEDLEL